MEIEDPKNKNEELDKYDICPKENTIKSIISAICDLIPVEPDKNISIEKLRNSVEKAPELFYFIEKTDKNFIKNLIFLNPTMAIDDIIYERLALLDIKSKCKNVLEWIYQILLNRYLSRTTLKHIFNNVVYLDFEGENECNYWKYNILTEIIKQYKTGDKIIEKLDKNPLIDIKILIEEIKGLSLDFKTIKNDFIDKFIDIKDIGNDNTQVLANIIWENTIVLLEYISKKDKTIETSSIMPWVGNNDLFEVCHILELFSVIIENTGQFYQNRITKNIKVFLAFQNIPGFKDLIKAIQANFDLSYENICKLIESPINPT